MINGVVVVFRLPNTLYQVWHGSVSPATLNVAVPSDIVGFNEYVYPIDINKKDDSGFNKARACVFKASLDIIEF
jgi:hypothetical protein